MTCEQPISPLPALARGFVTFGCLGNLAKVNAGVLALWARVLRAVPNSQLLLRAPGGEPRERLLAQLGGHGVDALRVRFVGRQLRPLYLATYREIDLCLDTFPYKRAHDEPRRALTRVAPKAPNRPKLKRAAAAEAVAASPPAPTALGEEPIYYRQAAWQRSAMQVTC